MLIHLANVNCRRILVKYKHVGVGITAFNILNVTDIPLTKSLLQFLCLIARELPIAEYSG